MTSEGDESSVPRPSVEGASGGSSAVAPESSVRKRVIMTKKFWSAEDISRLFRTLDKDSSGKLSFDEFESGMRQLGFEMKGDAVKALYRKMDVDGDGRVSEDEFLKLMRNLNREKLETQLSSIDRAQTSAAKKPKAVKVTVVDLGYLESAGCYQEYSYNRTEITKYPKDLPKWEKHCRWIDLYGNDPNILDLIGNECDLSPRMVDEATVKHSGKVQYYPEEKALLVAVHALFLTERPIQVRSQFIPGSRLMALFSRAPPATSPSSGIPMQELGRGRGSTEKKHFERDEDDEVEDEGDEEDKKEEADTNYEIVPERYYEPPRVNMSQIVIICKRNVIVTVRRRSGNTKIENIFNAVKDDFKNFLKTEIRSHLETPTTRDLLLTFLNELHEHNYLLRNSLNDWKLALEKDINANLNKYQARHLLDLNRTTSKSVQIVEPYVEDFLAMTSGESAPRVVAVDEKTKLTRQSSIPTGDEKKSYHKHLASAQDFIGDKKTAFGDCGEASQRLLSQYKYALDSATQLGEYYKHQMDDRQSKALAYLTVITGTIFPLQLFTGVYGMNFDVLPELHWEYSYLLFWIFNLIFMSLLLKFWHSRGFF